MRAVDPGRGYPTLMRRTRSRLRSMRWRRQLGSGCREYRLQPRRRAGAGQPAIRQADSPGIPRRHPLHSLRPHNHEALHPVLLLSLRQATAAVRHLHRQPREVSPRAGHMRAPDSGREFYVTARVVYLANSSGIKVGNTRATQLPTRWLDQGASHALPIMHLETRQRFRAGARHAADARMPIAPTGVRFYEGRINPALLTLKRDCPSTSSSARRLTGCCVAPTCRCRMAMTADQ
ncbi:hypothetical protein SSTU70S_01904 [Stutzerimonas stutzeri]